MDDPHAEVEIKPQLQPRDRVSKKKTQSLQTSSTSCRLKPHGHLGRLCVYGIYKRTVRAPTKENTIVLIAVDNGGEDIQEQDQSLSCPTAGPETSAVLESIPERQGGL